MRPPGGAGGAGDVKPLAPDTIKAIVDALAVNGGKIAKQALGEILAGTLKSDSDPTATQAALETLVRYRSPESEETLLKAITAPDSIRPKPKAETQGSTSSSTPGSAMSAPPTGPYGPPGSSAPSPGTPPAGAPPYAGSSSYPGMGTMGSSMYPGGGMFGGAQGGKVTAAELQNMALAVATPVATEEFRVRVANALTANKTAEEFRPAVSRFLMDPTPENLAAQFILLKTSAIDAAAKATIGSYFTTYSSQALCAILGIPVQSLKRMGDRAQGPGTTAGGYPGAGSSGTYGMPPGGGPPGQGSSISMPPPGSSASPSGTAPTGPPTAGTGSYPGMAAGGYPGMGMSSASGTGAGASQALSIVALAQKYAKEPELAYRVGRQLWAGDFVALATSRLDSIASLQAGAAEVLLASTVPTDAARAKLYQVLKRNWDEGPKALEAAGLGSTVISDPGLLAVIKALPRKDREQPKLTAFQRYRMEKTGDGAGTTPGMAPQPGQDQKTRQSKAKKAKGGQGGAAEKGAVQPGQPAPGSGAPGPSTAGQQAGQASEHPEFFWMDTSESLARAMCEQYAAAAKAAADKGVTVAEDSRPLELPAAANVVAEYHFDWPKGLAQPNGLPGVSPDAMTVHYVRMEQKTSAMKIFGYFRRRIIRPDEHPVSNGFWMESFRPVPKTDRQLSVDILVTKKEDPSKAQPAAAGAAGVPGAAGAAGAAGGMRPGGPAPGAGGAPPGPGTYGGGAPGAPQPGQRERAEKEEVGDLVVEILTVEVKSPAPIADRVPADEKEETSREKTPGKEKSKSATVE